MTKLTVNFIFVAIFCHSAVTTEEPVCSQFDYDKKIMEYITETRYQLKEMGKDLRRTEEYLLAVLERRKVEMDQLEESIKNKLEQGMSNMTDRVKNIEGKNMLYFFSMQYSSLNTKLCMYFLTTIIVSLAY